MNRRTAFDPGREAYPWERHLLEVCDLYLVGGTVREILRGAGAGSVDEDYLAAGIAYEDLVSRLERFGSVNLVGKSFGVIKFTPPAGRTVDVSLPRTEFSTGTAHRDFSVRFDPDLPVEKDLERRDFTVNSMALHLGTRALVDPLGEGTISSGGSSESTAGTRFWRTRCGFCAASSSWLGSSSR